MGFLKKLLKVVAVVAVVVGIGMIVAPAFMQALGTAVMEGLSAIGSAISSGFAAVGEALGFSAATTAEAASIAAPMAAETVAAAAPELGLSLGASPSALASAGVDTALTNAALQGASGVAAGAPTATQALTAAGLDAGASAGLLAPSASSLVAPATEVVKSGGMLQGFGDAAKAVGGWVKDNQLVASAGLQAVGKMMEEDPNQAQVEYQQWLRDRLNESINSQPPLPIAAAGQTPLRRTDGTPVYNNGTLRGGGMLQKRFPGYGG